MGIAGKFLMAYGKDIIDKPLEILDHQLAAYNERKGKAQEQELRQAQSEFEMNLRLKEREMNEKISDMIATNELERKTKMIDAIQNYQKTMAECAVSIGNSLGKMSIELRRLAYKLRDEKAEEYQRLQYTAFEKAATQFESINEKFPEGSKPRDIMEEAVGKQLNSIIDDAARFIKIMDEDFSKMLDSIQDVTKQSALSVNQYLSLDMANSVKSSLDNGNNTKLLK